MILFPAVDLLQGRAVRLLQGDYGKVTVYSERPADQAAAFAAAGATHLHLVDLDGARDGSAANDPVIRQIAGTSGLFVEVGGGVRSEERAGQLLAAGAGRVILGTAAVEDPALLLRLIARFGDKIAVGVDARDGKVATRGWLKTTGLDSFSFCRELREEGVGTVICTDIARDGGLSGPNFGTYEKLTGIRGLQVVASGGISTPEQLRRLAALGLAGAIVGKALYEGSMTVEAALGACGSGGEKS